MSADPGTGAVLVFPDPAPPELARTLDLSGFVWKAVGDEYAAGRAEPDAGWGGAVVCADQDPEGAFAVRQQGSYALSDPLFLASLP